MLYKNIVIKFNLEIYMLWSKLKLPLHKTINSEKNIQKIIKGSWMIVKVKAQQYKTLRDGIG